MKYPNQFQFFSFLPPPLASASAEKFPPKSIFVIAAIVTKNLSDISYNSRNYFKISNCLIILITPDDNHQMNIAVI